LRLRDVVVDRAISGEAKPKSAAQIVSIVPGSQADRAGLRSGDVIMQADGKVLPTGAQVAQAMADNRVLLLVRRGRSSFFAALQK
jgi:S1-C subfamily serine protease